MYTYAFEKRLMPILATRESLMAQCCIRDLEPQRECCSAKKDCIDRESIPIPPQFHTVNRCGGQDEKHFMMAY
ncbi:hypothetical protein ANO14919_063290 [Xylariales sp. No.14919]|nr:hypothetical protein ANO14919_063290 [Xylariales sp. No.14919]